MLTFYFRKWDDALVVVGNSPTTPNDQTALLTQQLAARKSPYHPLDRLVFRGSNTHTNSHACLDMTMLHRTLKIVTPYSRIQTLDARNVVLKYGTTHELSSWATALIKLPLKSFYLDRMRFQPPNTEKMGQQEPEQHHLPGIEILFRALAGIPLLKNVDCGQLLQKVHRTTVCRFLEDTNSLMFFKATFYEPQVVALAEYFRNKHDPNTSATTTAVVSVKHLEMNFDKPLSDSAADAVACILRTPSSLQQLALSFSSSKISEATVIRILRAGLDASSKSLSCSCIRKLYLTTLQHPSKHCIQVLEHQLENHYGLYKVLWACNNFLVSFPANIDICLRLNQMGRERVMRREPGGVNTQEWLTMLEAVKKDLDCLFFLLSRKPALLL